MTTYYTYRVKVLSTKWASYDICEVFQQLNGYKKAKDNAWKAYDKFLERYPLGRVVIQLEKTTIRNIYDSREGEVQ